MDTTKLSDILSGKNVYKRYLEFKESQWFSQSELKEIQLIKLKSLIYHCYENVPYYRNFMKKIDMIPSDIKSLDILRVFPIITKEIIKANYNDFTPVNLKKIKGVKISQTGGTTGNILMKRNDANSRSHAWGAYKRFEDWMGFKKGEKLLRLMGGHVIHKHNLKSIINDLKYKVIYYLENSIVFNPYDTEEDVVNKIISTLIKQDIKLIRGYPQYLYNLCCIMEKRGIRGKVPLIMTTAEPLLEEHRKLYKKILDSESYDQYGCGEIGGIAFECSSHEGLHITEENVIVETDENNNLICTDLNNYSMPFIRYYNADQLIIKSEKCSCGRAHRLIGKILGRECDYIIGLNGEYLHWAYFWHLIFDSNIAERRDLRKFQVIQNSRDSIEFHYVADELSSDEKNIIRDNIRNHIGNGSIDFIQEKDIPNSKSGKYRPVINKLI